jgi:hypothetical protein
MRFYIPNHDIYGIGCVDWQDDKLPYELIKVSLTFARPTSTFFSRSNKGLHSDGNTEMLLALFVCISPQRLWSDTDITELFDSRNV